MADTPNKILPHKMLPHKMLVSYVKDGDFAVTGFPDGGNEPRTEIASLSAILSTLLTWAVQTSPDSVDFGPPFQPDASSEHVSFSTSDLLDHLRGADARIRAGQWEVSQEAERVRINQERERINVEARLAVAEARAYAEAEGC